MKSRRIKVIDRPENAELITHGGTFHADEAMAAVILEQAMPGDGELYLCRVTGNGPIAEVPGQVVFDVGHGPLDHHQKGGNGVRPNGIPYASCGLVWEKYGMLVCKSMGSADPVKVWGIVNRELILAIDAHDCGYRPELPEGVKLAPSFTLPSLIAALNPNWDESTSYDTAFTQALNICRVALRAVIERAVSKVRAEAVVRDNINRSENGIMLMDCYAPWMDYMYPDEEDEPVLAKKAADILYVVYPGNRGGYQFRVVPATPGTFDQRNHVPEAWLGLTGVELQTVTGVSDATFVHPNGFIGGAQTLEGCMELAAMAIAEGSRDEA